MRRWQYKVVATKVLANMNLPDSHEDSEREVVLNAYGRDGWELVSVIYQRYQRESDPMLAFGYAYSLYYFKREVEQDTISIANA